MKKYLLGLFILALFFISSCTEHSTENILNTNLSFSYSSSKCMDLMTTVIKIEGSWDSLFVYKFNHDTLSLNFSAPGNCCPDSNRFEAYSFLKKDTIFIMVTDTAEYRCRCICTYYIHAEYTNLFNDHYVVRCILKSIQAPNMNRDTLHLVNVYRFLD